MLELASAVWRRALWNWAWLGIILIFTLNKWQGRACTGLCGLEYGLVLDFCEHGNEPSCYVICGDFFFVLRQELLSSQGGLYLLWLVG